jgi:hypothetical protein
MGEKDSILVYHHFNYGHLLNKGGISVHTYFV